MTDAEQHPREDTPEQTEAARQDAPRPDVAPQNAPAEPHVVRVSEPDLADPDLRKKELIDAVLERCDIKKRDAKPVIEATLAVMGETMGEGRGLNLEPMGKLRINRVEEKTDRRIVICKLRQKTEAAGAEATDPDGAAADSLGADEPAPGTSEARE